MGIKRYLGLLFIIFIIGCNVATKDKDGSNMQVVKHKEQETDLESLAKEANLFYQQNNYSQAITCYNTLISIDSTKGGYYFKRGYCKSMLLNSVDAIADYKKAIACNYSEKKKAYLNIGVLYRVALNQYDSAIYYYNEYLKLEPNDDKAKQEKKAATETLKKLK